MNAQALGRVATSIQNNTKYAKNKIEFYQEIIKFCQELIKDEISFNKPKETTEK
jgi:hypothetical protein